MPRQPGVRAEMLAGLPKEIEEYIINPEEKCSVCGGKLKVIGKTLIRTDCTTGCKVYGVRKRWK